MAFSKTIFVDNQTVIDADTLNAIQDELIRVAGLLGKDIQSAAINDSGHLILTLTDDTTLDAGVAKGDPASDAQVTTAVSAYLESHPEATTTVQDGAITTVKIADAAVTEEKTSYFSTALVELIGEMEVGFQDTDLKGYHKKTFPVEPGKTYVFYPGSWTQYYNSAKEEITVGWTLENNILTIPEDSSLRFIRCTVLDAQMTDSFPCCYEGTTNTGRVPRGTREFTFAYAGDKKDESAFAICDGKNLIDGSKCTLLSGTTYLSQLIPVSPGERYYQSSTVGAMRVFNRYGNELSHTWTYQDDWQPDTGAPVTGNRAGVYTIPPNAFYVKSTTTLTNGIPDHAVIRAAKKIPKSKIGKQFIETDAERETAKDFFDCQHLIGLTFAYLGDSISAKSQYGKVIAENYGMQCISGATDGARYTATESYSENIAYNKVNALSADADVVVLMFGTNDISNALPIGEFFDGTLYTLYGALRKTFDLLTTKYNGKRIGVITSPQRNFSVVSYDTWDNYNGIIKKMAMLYGIPALDGHYAGMIWGSSNDYGHFTDDVHPSASGSTALAYNIGKFIETLPIYKRDG